MKSLRAGLSPEIREHFCSTCLVTLLRVILPVHIELMSTSCNLQHWRDAGSNNNRGGSRGRVQGGVGKITVFD